MSSADDDLIERSKARLGMLLRGKYTLDRILGIGGMATVYAATHRNGKEFAIKVLHAELSLRSETRTRFLREGYLANRVSHPGAVAVLDDDVGEDGSAFLVMELLRGQTVEDIWERHRARLPLPMVAGIGIQLLEVLSAAHARGLIHRDIKPSNLMLTDDGQVKVLDFGIARLRDMANSKTTQTGMVMGTPAFMAPEHALAKTEEIDAQTDLWAVGATMFTLATGLLVHEADNTQQLLVRAATSPARPFASVMPGAPAPICAIVDRALAFNKRERWPDATAMQTALREASRASFEKVPTQQVLAELLEELVEHERTNILGATDPPPPGGAVLDPRAPLASHSSARSAMHSAETQATPSVPGGEPAPAIALVTGAALATDSARRTASKPRGAMAIGVAAGALALTALLFVFTRGTQSTDAGTAGPATRAASSAVAPRDSAPVVVPTATAAWTAVPVAPSPSPSPSPLRKPATSLPPVTPNPPAAPRSRPVAASPGPAVTAAAPAPAPAKASCNPPYEFDQDGNKRWKRECL